MFSAIWRGSLKVYCLVQLLTYLKSPFLSNWKCQISCLPCHIQISAKLSLISQTQIFLSSWANKIFIKFNQDSFAYIPSLKSVFIQVISNLIDYFLLRLTRRHPSPDLVGLATRLSVVWCYPRFRLSQPKVDLGHNTRNSTSYYLFLWRSS